MGALGCWLGCVRVWLLDLAPALRARAGFLMAMVLILCVGLLPSGQHVSVVYGAEAEPAWAFLHSTGTQLLTGFGGLFHTDVIPPSLAELQPFVLDQILPAMLGGGSRALRAAPALDMPASDWRLEVEINLATVTALLSPQYAQAILVVSRTGTQGEPALCLRCACCALHCAAGANAADSATWPSMAQYSTAQHSTAQHAYHRTHNIFSGC